MQAVLAQPAMDEQSNECTEIAGRLGIRGLTMTQWRFRTQVGPVRPESNSVLAPIPERFDRGLASMPRSRA